MKAGVSTCLVLLVYSTLCWATGERNPSGGRAAAMGGTSVACVDFWSVNNNQAGLAWLPVGAAGFCFENRFTLADIMLEGVALALPFKAGTAGLAISRFGNANYNEIKAGVVVARRFGNHFGAGLQFDYSRIHLAGDYGNKSVISFQIGLIFQPDKKMSVGVQIVNPIPIRITSNPVEHLPACMNLGVAYNFSNQFNATVEIEKDLQHPPVIRAGAEYHFIKPLFARIGISTSPMSFSFGFGVTAGKITIDIASGYHPSLGFSPSGSVVYSFKR